MDCHGGKKDKGIAGCGGDGKGKRGWSVLTKGAEVLNDVKDAWGVAFLDMDEDVSASNLLEACSITMRSNILSREVLILWSSGLAAKKKEICFSYRITSIMMPSS